MKMILWNQHCGLNVKDDIVSIVLVHFFNTFVLCYGPLLPEINCTNDDDVCIYSAYCRHTDAIQ